jgi:hypothetical protein
VFTLRQSLTAYKQCQQLIQSCDHEIEQYLSAFESKAIPGQPLKKAKDRHNPRRNEMRFDRVYARDFFRFTPSIQVSSEAGRPTEMQRLRGS